MGFLKLFHRPSLRLCAMIGLLAMPASAQEISPSALFNRCYAQLTGHPVPLNDPRLSAIRKKQLDPITACMQVLNKAQLMTNNLVANPSDPEARLVLATMHTFHRSWFVSATEQDIQGFSYELDTGTRDVFDTTEPALALTYNLFKTDAPYKDVLRTPQGFVAFRADDQSVKSKIGFTVTFPNRGVFGNNTVFDQNAIQFRRANTDGNGIGDPNVAAFSDFFNLPKIQVGELYGIAPQGSSFATPNYSVQPLFYPSRWAHNTPGVSPNIDIYRSFGGGVLGLPIHLMMNWGHPRGLSMNGAEKLPRTWVKHSLETFMCAQFPALRLSDVPEFIDTASGTAPFRQGSSCLRCHATLDQAAGVARNLFTATSDDLGINARGKTISLMGRFVADRAATGWPSRGVSDYHRQASAGRLYIRSFTGELIDKSVNGLSALGEAASNTDDYYQCAAKRYFEYFTGVKVLLYDRGDSRYESVNQSLSTQDAVNRRYIEALAQDFRKHQSQVRLIQEILTSSAYRQLNRTEKTGGSK